MKKCRYAKQIRTVALFIIVLLTFSCGAYFKVRPILCDTARDSVDNVLSDSVNYSVQKALKNGNYTYENLSVLSRAENGEILSIEIDTVRLNLLKTDISKGISEYLAQRENMTYSLPLGNLLLTEYTNGMGPKIHIPVEMSATSAVTYQNGFESVAINQSLHKISMNIQFHARYRTVGCSKDFIISIDVPVAQTVIVGKVPDSYFNIIDDSGIYDSNDVLNFAEVG